MRWVTLQSFISFPPEYGGPLLPMLPGKQATVGLLWVIENNILFNFGI
jgi:hypothetical protein